MDLSMDTYRQQMKNADLLRKRLRFPIAHGQNLPLEVDLRPWMTEIEDQGDMGSCVANTVAGALEYLYRRYTGRVIDVSRLFIDFNARLSNLDWSQTQNRVINISDPGNAFETNRYAAMRAVQQYGFCKESIWPYSSDLFKRIPPQNVYDEAARRSIIPLKVPINIISIKTCLAHQIPVLIGIELSTDEANVNHGYVQIPLKKPNEGYHSCLIVGYNDCNQHFTIRNSWGVDWGDKGYCYVPYQYLIDPRLVLTAEAFWAIPAIIPRHMARKGYMNYPNFTLYHKQFMLPYSDGYYFSQHKKPHHRRRRYFHH